MRWLLLIPNFFISDSKISKLQPVNHSPPMADQLPDSSNEQPNGFLPVDADDPEVNVSVQEHVLCSQCSNLIKKSRNINQGVIFTKYEQFGHYSSFQEVKRSAHDGCHLCSLIWWEWKDVYQRQLETPSGSGRYVTVEFEKSRAPVMIDRMNVNPFGQLGERHATTPGFDYRFLTIERYQSVSSRPRDFGYREAKWLDSSKPWHGSQLALSTASDATFLLAKYWVQKCLKHHKECCKAQLLTTQWPTRILEVGPKEGIRLVVTSDLIQKPEYLTLSHCWGGASISKLVSGNISLFQENIQLDSLPKTFRDAILITRRLGYDYLWIDSLCIIQDSTEDWSRESSIMGMIYQRSVCTIAALAAQNSHQGCFTKRNPLYYRHCRVLGDSAKGVYVLGTTTPKMWVTGGYGSPCKLNQRGWVVQERLLSPRTLHFGPKSIGWECIECEATETEPDEEASLSMLADSLRPKTTFAFLGQSISKNTPVNSGEFVAFRNAWWTIVSTYTGCDLTFGHDKLVAIAGIIRVIESRTGLTSIAGHWKEFLLQDMLWKAVVSAKRAQDYRAPSWSWASIDKHVYGTYFDDIYTPVCNSETKMMYDLDWLAQVKDSGAIPLMSGSVWSGQVSGGFIKLQAKALMVEYGDYKGCQWLFDDEKDKCQQALFILIVRGTKRFNQTGSRYRGRREYQDEGLILSPTNETKSEWRRIGLFFQTYQTPTENALFSAPTTERVVVIV